MHGESTIFFDVLPYLVCLFHHLLVVGLDVGSTDDPRASTIAALTVNGCMKTEHWTCTNSILILSCSSSNTSPLHHGGAL